MSTTFKKEKTAFPMTSTHQSSSLEEITNAGEKFYLNHLKEKLEKENMGHYAVIDVEQKKYHVDPDRLIAVEKARKDFGDKLFYIVQIGSIQNPSINFTTEKYAWNFA
jgi:hypothetical protein